ncbi:putative prophage phiRv2 integrase [Pseudolysinimonas kribbensis]|uniref:Prophage phiRv2 integrase n=1 Tax=Pseudolysinimonas kribbensis TaxID=433641 RepID=A0ABQ6KE27_9MICO|nr:tyrosine-type recombinase/integrase [Pseudolysinimonas kribbensis]GMA96919.1 putative prophage phiRv2 integrase [Pseudolysinimonas kribbensis]
MPTRPKATTTDALGRTVPTTRKSWGSVMLLPSGNYRARYVGPDGLKHSAPSTFTTKIDADAWLASQRVAIDRGEWTPATTTASHAAQADRSQTFLDYATKWISTRTNASGEPLRHRTRDEYVRLLATVLQPLADIPLASMKASTVRDWYSELIASGRKTTASRAYGFARSVMATAVRDGLVANNPVEVRGAQNATTGRETVPPTDAELAIIEANMPPQLRAALLIAAWGGLRFGELTELRRRDLIHDDDLIRIRITRAVTRTTSDGFVVGKPKSRAGIRDVALPPSITSDVLDHLRDYAEPGEDGLLFPSKNGGHMGEPELNRSGWYAARAAAGRDDLPWHGLRHYGLTKYAIAGATTRELQDRGGTRPRPPRSAISTPPPTGLPSWPGA